MKTIFVMLLLSALMVLLVILMDVAMGVGLSGIFAKEMEPFKVTGHTDIVILSIFAVYFVIKAVVGFIKKKQQNNSQS